jgi:hypothetical protein
MTGFAVVLLAVGLAGVVAGPIYRQLCEWADMGLMTAHARRRVAVVQRRLPVMTIGSAGMASAGLLLGLVEVLAAA